MCAQINGGRGREARTPKYVQNIYSSNELKNLCINKIPEGEVQNRKTPGWRTDGTSGV